MDETLQRMGLVHRNRKLRNISNNRGTEMNTPQSYRVSYFLFAGGTEIRTPDFSYNERAGSKEEAERMADAEFIKDHPGKRIQDYWKHVLPC
jgi:hypothetical protein